MVKITGAPIGPGFGQTNHKVMVITKEGRERKTPTSYRCLFALNWFSTREGQTGKNKGCSDWPGVWADKP